MKRKKRHAPTTRPRAKPAPPARATPTPALPTIPYKIAVLVYIFNDAGKLLLLHRKKPPNQDLYSPIGGKLEQALGESPYACALREIAEEVGIRLTLADLHLLGIVSERAFPGSTPTPNGVAATAPGGAGPRGPGGPGTVKGLPAHWLMFCFEVTRPLNFPARPMNEGQLEWFDLEAVPSLDIPKTDREVIWPLVQNHAAALRGPLAGQFFSVHIDCRDADHFAIVREHPLP